MKTIGQHKFRCRRIITLGPADGKAETLHEAVHALNRAKKAESKIISGICRTFHRPGVNCSRPKPYKRRQQAAQRTKA